MILLVCRLRASPGNSFKRSGVGLPGVASTAYFLLIFPSTGLGEIEPLFLLNHHIFLEDYYSSSQTSILSASYLICNNIILFESGGYKPHFYREKNIPKYGPLHKTSARISTEIGKKYGRHRGARRFVGSQLSSFFHSLFTINTTGGYFKRSERRGQALL